MKLDGYLSPSREGIGEEEINFLITSGEKSLLAISDSLQLFFSNFDWKKNKE